MGSQSDDAKENLGRGKEASSFLEISSAKSVPELTFLNFLVSLSMIDMAEKEDNEKHDNAAFLVYVWHGLRFLAKVFADQRVQSTPALYLFLVFARAILNELFPLAGESTPIKNLSNGYNGYRWTTEDYLCVTPAVQT